MDLDNRALVGGQGIMKGPRGMSEGTRIYDDARNSSSRIMDEFDEFTLVITLMMLNLKT